MLFWEVFEAIKTVERIDLRKKVKYYNTKCVCLKLLMYCLKLKKKKSHIK